jgi:hypothetical protein
MSKEPDPVILVEPVTTQGEQQNDDAGTGETGSRPETGSAGFFGGQTNEEQIAETGPEPANEQEAVAAFIGDPQAEDEESENDDGEMEESPRQMEQGEDEAKSEMFYSVDHRLQDVSEASHNDERDDQP